MGIPVLQTREVRALQARDIWHLVEIYDTLSPSEQEVVDDTVEAVKAEVENEDLELASLERSFRREDLHAE